MNKLIKKPSYQVKLERFKNGGQIEKCQLGDVLQKGQAYVFNGQDGTFDEAFRNVRNEGQKYFRWDGKLYNTEYKKVTPDIEKPSTIDFSDITTTNNRPYNPEDIQYINQKLQNIDVRQRAAILANIIEESGGDPFAKGPGGFYGLLQWGPERYTPKSADRKQEMDNQINHILSTLHNTTDKMSWHHGGTGSGYRSAQQAHDAFADQNIPVDSINWAFTLGYVRPSGKINSAQNRSRVAQQIYDLIK